MRVSAVIVAGVVGGLLLSGCASGASTTGVSIETTADPAQWTAPPQVGSVDSGERALENGVDSEVYIVVVNHEQQYSIWLKRLGLPLGWQAAGFEGTKDDCLAYIDKVWADMRPLTLRS